MVCAGIHLSDIPSFPYKLLWQERQIVSVANLARRDATDFFKLVQKIKSPRKSPRTPWNVPTPRSPTFARGDYKAQPSCFPPRRGELGQSRSGLHRHQWPLRRNQDIFGEANRPTMSQQLDAQVTSRLSYSLQLNAAAASRRYKSRRLASGHQSYRNISSGFQFATQPRMIRPSSIKRPKFHYPRLR